MLQPEIDTLRVATAGSVDDGKSTLIGRLLYETKAVHEDVLESLMATSSGVGDVHFNLALVTDGLRAEREQGITIDVAYRYFTTPIRRFILADTPGHIQYTRNMITGASTSEVAMILVDAAVGLTEQTYRHANVASILRVPRVIFVINKMDLVGYDRGVFDSIALECNHLAKELRLEQPRIIPISALFGENIVSSSKKMSWYEGQPLLATLENLNPVELRHSSTGLRFSVQWVIRSEHGPRERFRGYAGAIHGGTLSCGQRVLLYPSMRECQIGELTDFDGALMSASSPKNVIVQFTEQSDVSRGDMISSIEDLPRSLRRFNATVFWMSAIPLAPGGRFRMKHLTNYAHVTVIGVDFRVELGIDGGRSSVNRLLINDIGKCHIEVASDIYGDSYERNRTTGSFILLDIYSNATVGAGIIDD